MSKLSSDMNSMMTAMRRSRELGCSGAHRDSSGNWQPCSSAAEKKRREDIKRRPIEENTNIRTRKGSNKLSTQWEPLGQRGVVAIATLDGGGLVSGAAGKQLRSNDLETYSDIRVARQRARQLGCIGVARRITSDGKEVWTPCTNMSDLSRLAGLTPLGRRRQREAQETFITEALRKRMRQENKPGSRRKQFDNDVQIKRLSGRLGGGLRVPPPGMVFVDVSGAIDGDRDGIINEGRPDERPIVPARMISQQLADSLPRPELSTSGQMSSVELTAQDVSAPPVRQAKKRRTSESRPFASSQEELKSRLNSDEISFLRRLSRNPGYASEVPDRIVMAGGDDLLNKIRRQNVQAHISAMRSMRSNQPTGGRAMSDLIMGRIDGEEFGKPEPTMYFIGGTMGAGKSTIVSNSGDITSIPGLDKAAHIDPDEIKTALPGWDGGRGASRVHAQSRVVTDKILDRAVSSRTDIVIQGTGKRNEHLHQARQNGYKTVGHYMWVPSDISAERIKSRAKRGGTQVEPYLGPLIASELQGIVHRQITGDLLSEFYLWDTRNDVPTLIASFDGESEFQINDTDAFEDFLGKYGADRVRAHWKAIGKEKSKTSQVMRSSNAGSLNSEQKRPGLADRVVADGFRKETPLSRFMIGDKSMVRADLTGSHIKSGEDLSGLDMKHANANSIHAPGVNFSGARMFGISMSRANLYRAKLHRMGEDGQRTDLRFGHLTYLQAKEANFSGANLFGANLTGANLSGANLRNTNLQAARLDGADLRGTDLRGAQLSDGALNNARIDKTTILPDGTSPESENNPSMLKMDERRNSAPRRIPIAAKGPDDGDRLARNIRGGRVVADGEDLSGSALDNRNIDGALLSDIDLSRSELERASFIGSQMSTVSMSGSMMDRASLSKATLTNVKLNGINGRHMSLTGSRLNRVNLSRADLREANLENLVADGEVDLRGADLRGAFLAGADLRKAIIDENTKFDGIRTDGRTKLPRGVDQKKLGSAMRSRSQREFNDFLLAEVVENARYERRPAGAESLSLTGIASQPEEVRGQIVAKALSKLLARDIQSFGPDLTDVEHRNINQRISMAHMLRDMAEDRMAKSVAMEEMDILDSLSDDEVNDYISDSLFGSLANQFNALIAAIEVDMPSTATTMNDMSTISNELAEKNDSALQRLANRALQVERPSRTQNRPNSGMRSIAGSTSSGNRVFNGMRASSKTAQIYEDTVNAVIEALENADGGKWERPWALGSGMPRNGTTGKYYKGANVFWLNVAQVNAGYEKPVWATYKQWQKVGGQVRKGEKGTLGIKWTPVDKVITRADGSQTVGTTMIPSAFTVFNLDQIDGVERSQFDVAQLSETERVERLETILSEMTLPVRFDNPDSAHYNPLSDYINLPPFSAFKDARAYYSTLAHEAVHWTGGSARLDRDNMHRFGTPEYAYEELVAELGSTMFMSLMGLDPMIQEQHAPYLKGWLSLLKDKPEALQKAINDAQKAVDYLIELSPTLKKDMQAQVIDADIFDDPEAVDAMEGSAREVAQLAMRSSNKRSLNRDFNVPPGTLAIENPSREPLPMDEVAGMTEEKLVKLIADDRLAGMSAEELANKYHISQREALEALRKYAEWLDGKMISDSRPFEKSLVMRRDGRSTKVPISEMSISEVELALQYVRRDISRAKNARELRSQKKTEELLLSRLQKLRK